MNEVVWGLLPVTISLPSLGQAPEPITEHLGTLRLGHMA